MKKLYIYIAILCSIISITSCKKLIEIKPSTGFVITDQVFKNTDDATAAVAGMFYKMGSTGVNYANAGSTIFCGLSADELMLFTSSQDSYVQFQTNSLNASNGLVLSSFWSPAFSVIYEANAVIAGLERSLISDSTKNRLKANALFARAFTNFYLTSYFGAIPLVTTINYRESSLLSRTSTENIYTQIVKDLVEAQNYLPENYNNAGGLRIEPTKWAAKALLARVYLYQKDWANAEAEATDLINNTSLFSLMANLNDVFLTTSKEAIWQIQPNKKQSPFFANQEAINFIPFPSQATSAPNFVITPELLAQFETGDLRLRDWTGQTSYQSQSYIYPYKYKLGKAAQSASTPFTECNTALRLAEQWLIRAEARAEKNNLNGALEDLNRIRARAGLDNKRIETKEEMLAAIYREKQIEFFAEWGHRWFDLKRWGIASQILGPIKASTWQETDQVYPLPSSELQTGPNLDQNAGY
ncbi:RagB/SusD family nutrient uptake outer membrane protein [Niabella pedocola]|uniref:RagB/SusD family nutrient uptake outer membrane protein n=1 Tax=Niabella pedocola TaxID=1752077 RepID=A0ABS8PTC6_9BACT|nr:RagB/SusD family nutrient uptake outer membrane protein [Niabella pedocola]MCD2424319.1 RagB/SusD family nutrient uptake outer membrane protein [Niabella pedocola]